MEQSQIAKFKIAGTVPTPKELEEMQGFQFFSLFKDGYHFCLRHDPKLDGFHSDINGNNQLPTIKDFAFTKVPVKDPETGKTSSKLGYQTFIGDRAKQGEDFERIYLTLLKKTENPDNRLYTKDAWHKRRNPEAFAVNEQLAKQAIKHETEISEANKKIADLEKRLGLKR